MALIPVGGNYYEGVVVVNPTTGGASTSQATAGDVAAGSADSGNPVKVGGVYNATLPTYATGQRTAFQTDQNGRQLVAFSPKTTGGVAPTVVNSAASTNLTSLKAAAGQVFGVQLSNSGAAWAFLKLYNKASAPVLASDVPAMIIGIPPGGRCEVNRVMGNPFSTGIAYAIVGGATGAANTDTTAVAVNQVVGTIDYV